MAAPRPIRPAMAPAMAPEIQRTMSLRSQSSTRFISSESCEAVAGWVCIVFPVYHRPDSGESPALDLLGSCCRTEPQLAPADKEVLNRSESDNRKPRRQDEREDQKPVIRPDPHFGG